MNKRIPDQTFQEDRQDIKTNNVLNLWTEEYWSKFFKKIVRRSRRTNEENDTGANLSKRYKGLQDKHFLFEQRNTGANLSRDQAFSCADFHGSEIRS